jgi:uncharacterized membrane protein
MTAFTVAFDLVVTAVMAALLLAMPSIVRPTLPLGVSVPQSRIGEPVVRSAVRGYRWGVVAVWAVCAAVGIGVATVRPELVLALLPLLFLLLSAIVYVVVRRRIVVAKRDGAWYDSVPTRLIADATPRRPGHPPSGWLLASLIVICATAAVGVAVYPTLPAVIPTHWDAAGQVDATSPKSVWSVFTLTLVALGVVLGLYVLSWLVRVSPGRPVASDTPERTAARTDAQRHLGTTGLGVISLALALGMGVTALASWLAPSSPGVMSAALVVTLALTLGALAVIVVSYSRGMSRANATSRTETKAPARSGAPVRPGTSVRPASERPVSTQERAAQRADAPDDDRHWKLGAIYLNRDDPAVFVPKRFGIGWTINLGSVGGIVFAAVTVLVVVGSIVASIVSAAH